MLTVALVALAELLAVGARMHQLGRRSGTAALLASDKFEELMKLDFDTAPALQINANDTLAADVANYFDVPAGSGYTRRWRVQPGPGGNAALRAVTVRLVPSGGAGAGLEVTSILRSW